MRKPILVYTSPKGATVHSYDLEGGKRTFERYLGCYLGSCVFHNTLEEAKEAVKIWHNFVKPISFMSVRSLPPQGVSAFFSTYSDVNFFIMWYLVSINIIIKWYLVRASAKRERVKAMEMVIVFILCPLASLALITLISRRCHVPYLPDRWRWERARSASGRHTLMGMVIVFILMWASVRGPYCC